jgi:hypothetical protein
MSKKHLAIALLSLAGFVAIAVAVDQFLSARQVDEKYETVKRFKAYMDGYADCQEGRGAQGPHALPVYRPLAD